MFEELRGIVRNSFGVAELLKEAMASFVGRIAVAFLFGSVARGTETAASDVDVLVIGDVRLMEVVSAIGDAQRGLGREVNPCVYRVGEFSSKLAKGQHFIQCVMAGPKVFSSAMNSDLRNWQKNRGLREQLVNRIADFSRSAPGDVAPSL